MSESSEQKSTPRQSDEQRTSFEEGSQQHDPGLAAEFLDFLLHNKKWWLIPILVVMLLLTVLTFLAASPVAPFIYTLF